MCPKPLTLVTPAMCLVWLGDESRQGEFLQQKLFFPLISSFPLALTLPQEPDTSPCTKPLLQAPVAGAGYEGNHLCNKKPVLIILSITSFVIFSLSC